MSVEMASQTSYSSYNFDRPVSHVLTEVVSWVKHKIEWKDSKEAKPLDKALHLSFSLSGLSAILHQGLQLDPIRLSEVTAYGKCLMTISSSPWSLFTERVAPPLLFRGLSSLAHYTVRQLPILSDETKKTALASLNLFGAFVFSYALKETWVNFDHNHCPQRIHYRVIANTVANVAVLASFLHSAYEDWKKSP